MRRTQMRNTALVALMILGMALPGWAAKQKANWIQTVPGKGWNTILRLYSPTEAWFDKTWRPGEIERLH